MGIVIQPNYCTAHIDRVFMTLDLIPICVLTYKGNVVGYRVGYQGNIVDMEKDDAIAALWDFGDVDVTSCTLQSAEMKDFNGTLMLDPTEKVGSLTYWHLARYYEKQYGVKDFAKTDATLKVMYNHYNKTLFNNRLPRIVTVCWSNRLTSAAGNCWQGRNIGTAKINISTFYHSKYPEDLKNTLVHEMIHVLYPRAKHNQAFVNAMMQINNLDKDLNVTVNSKEAALIRYVYKCTNCGTLYTRANRIDTRTHTCGKCQGQICEINPYDLLDDYDTDVAWEEIFIN